MKGVPCHRHIHRVAETPPPCGVFALLGGPRSPRFPGRAAERRASNSLRMAWRAQSDNRRRKRMSVLVTVKAAADTDQFRRFTETAGDLMVKIAEDGKAQGAIHHRFGIGDGFVMVFDEWEDAESFQ